MEDNTVKQHPPEREAFDRIMEVIEYGKVFKWEQVCEWMGIEVEKAKEDRGWEFNTPWLNLARMLRSQGYFITERGMDNEGFRVLLREECADRVKSEQYRFANSSIEQGFALSKIPREGLDEIEAKKMDHWEQKCILVGTVTKSLLRKRELPSPEMAIKSLKQIA